jgi:hypothetical protein
MPRTFKLIAGMARSYKNAGYRLIQDRFEFVIQSA